MPEKSAKKKLQRILILASGLAFLGSTGVFLIGVFNNPSPSNPEIQTQTDSVEEKLKQQEKGYEAVLQREPNNPAALQGLVETRLQMGNLQGAIEPTKKLIEIYPNEPKLKELLAAIEQRTGE
jgi:predicted Zn-dependent protease